MASAVAGERDSGTVEESHHDIQLFVSICHRQQPMTLLVPRGARVEELQRALRARLQSHGEGLVGDLEFAGKVLRLERRLSEYGISDGSILRELPDIRGGMHQDGDELLVRVAAILRDRIVDIRSSIRELQKDQSRTLPINACNLTANAEWAPRKTSALNRPRRISDAIDLTSCTQGEVAAYLQSTKNRNATIEDSLSGEKLDILTQCVNLSLTGTARSAEKATGTNAIANVRDSLHRTVLALQDQVKVCFGGGDAQLLWMQASISGKADDENYHLRFHETIVTIVSGRDTPITDEQLAAAHHDQRLFSRDESGVLPADASNQGFQGRLQKRADDRYALHVESADASFEAGAVPVDRVEVEITGGSRVDGAANQSQQQREKQRGLIFLPSHARAGLDPSATYEVELVSAGSAPPTAVSRHAHSGADLRVLSTTPRVGFKLTQTLDATPVPRTSLISQPVLLTGEAACGKSTFTKQYVFDTASKSLERGTIEQLPVMVRVIDLANTLTAAAEQRGAPLSPDEDLLDLHFASSHFDDTTRVLLRDMRRQKRLILLLDGMDEAGACRELLEAYISCRLVTEVHLCVTARPQGIARMGLFDPFFIGVRVAPLDEEQQTKIVRGRFEARPLEGTDTDARVKSLQEQMSANPSFQELAENPLLLNLIVSEFMLHERDGEDIEFFGRIVEGRTIYVASFPGAHKREWDRVTQVLQDKNVACVFLPESSPLYGAHAIDLGAVVIKGTLAVGRLVITARSIPSLLEPGASYEVELSSPVNSDVPARVVPYKGSELIFPACYCQTFLYCRAHPCGEDHNCPENVQRYNLEFIMDDGDVHIAETTPPPGAKVEVQLERLVRYKQSEGDSEKLADTVIELLKREAVKAADGGDATDLHVRQWWVCTVICPVRVRGGEYDGKTGHLKPPAYTLKAEQAKIEVVLDEAGECLEMERASLEVEERVDRVKVKFDGLGRAVKPRWMSMSLLNQTGTRKTKQQPGQAPFGCEWFCGWKDAVEKAEVDKQQAQVVFKKGKCGVRSFDGLGASQQKEVLFLEQRHGYRKDGKSFIEVDATEFEAENTLNRAQIYKSAVDGLIRTHGSRAAIEMPTTAVHGRKRSMTVEDAVFADTIIDFLQMLSYSLFVENGDQFRNFDDAFVEQHALKNRADLLPVWQHLRPLVHDSR